MKSLALLLLLATPALAQDDSPWGTPSDDAPADDGAPDGEAPPDEDGDAPDAEAPEEPPEALPAEDGLDAPPLADEATDPEGGDGEGAADAPEDGPIVTTTAAAPADATDVIGGNVPSGVRIAPYGAGTGVDVAQAFVVGANGGTNQTLLRARYATGPWGFQVALPFVAHRLPRQARDIGLGNLQLDAWRQLGDGSRGFTAVALELHGNLGDRTYSWVHDADDVWPGYGADLSLQTRRGGERFTTMSRVALGLRTGRAYEPWAGTYVTFEAAFGIDADLADRIGVQAETSIAYWDLSPWDLSGLLRADIAQGLRARGGLVLPLGVWAGIPPIDQDLRGVREATLLVDLSMSL